ncbi:MAG: YhbY family RNA-binding protein [Eubacteriales bacterium]|jgi:RNA-binding protein|nr:YhbY family RNA-binding protein [Eubacteriales bacterium]
MLSGKQRSYLKKLGQSLRPIVFIGRDGLTENVMQEMDTCLLNRELIKVKLQEGCTLHPKETANEAADALGAEFVQAIGKRFVLYRRSEKEDLRERIVLPR